MLAPLPEETVTPDRGKEFTKHQDLTDKLKEEVYFPDPHVLWQRVTNENTNGLLREYFPKGSDLTFIDEHTIQLWEDKLIIDHESVSTGKHLMKFSMKKMCT